LYGRAVRFDLLEVECDARGLAADAGAQQDADGGEGVGEDGFGGNVSWSWICGGHWERWLWRVVCGVDS
jgi:hypothetical protein